MAAILITYCALSTSVTQASDVLIMVDETRGQGILQQRGDECLIITPKHVVEDAESFDIELVFPDRSIGTAVLVERFAEDVAVLRPHDVSNLFCEDQPFSDIAISEFLPRNEQGTLRMLDSDGSTQLLQVNIEGFDAYKTIRIIPTDPNTPIQQGFSGSRLYIEGQLVGMLTSVEEGIGVVIQSTTLNAVVDPFFNAADEGNRIRLIFDDESELLRPALEADAGANGYHVVDDSDAWIYTLSVTSSLETVASESDKLVRYATMVRVADQRNKQRFTKELNVLGNSFVSESKALSNARKNLITSVEKLDIFSNIR